MSDIFEGANCRSADPDAMFPDKGRGSAGVRDARMICAGCPMAVWSACLDKALRLPADQVQGVWASTTIKQRVELRKQWRDPEAEPVSAQQLRRALVSS